ncbi:MAG: hypothetical protein ACI9EV_002254, partial [Urechidicola sp.]
MNISPMVMPSNYCDYSVSFFERKAKLSPIHL